MPLLYIAAVYSSGIDNIWKASNKAYKVIGPCFVCHIQKRPIRFLHD